MTANTLSPVLSRCTAGALALLTGLLLSVSVHAEPEQAQLTLILRQLDMLERQAQSSAQSSTEATGRYHFDYPRLQADIGRIRTGIHDYLTPQRAQPRDPVLLSGDYQREAKP
ncbi:MULTISPECIES: integrative conjugative element protein, RAQPRD family [unclassified Serratia (in: enterobacteria)]|uniref:integrative conjugative element protein, RAQPRD family n=1 Tax=unclassified Serratia (in: enterobacteria) TaxID=2647522 RepID=UPI0030766710